MQTSDSRQVIDEISQATTVLLDPKQKIAFRFRALFTLRNSDAARQAAAAKAMIECLKLDLDQASALLKHECAYCLGQVGGRVPDIVVPALLDVLADEKQPIIARHEAGEALGAIACSSSLPALEAYAKLTRPDADRIPIEVVQTCQLAIDRINFVEKGLKEKTLSSEELVSPFESIDPSLPAECSDLKTLGRKMCDKSLSLFDRYRAMFSLRNIAGSAEDVAVANEAVTLLADGFELSGAEEALFRHEIAFVLGQIGNRASAAAKPLLRRLEDADENPMVRHEAAEALGSIALEDYVSVLEKFAKDPEPIVSESCAVALDLVEYHLSSDAFEYATVTATA